MSFDFDIVSPRLGTHSLRWDTVNAKFGEPDLIPLTTADMDFPTAPCVREALSRALDHGIFGYPDAGEGYFNALAGSIRRRSGWEIQKDWLCVSPGVVNGVAYALQSLTQMGDGVLLPSPMYHPFAHLIEDNGRKVVRTSLRPENGRYELDLEDFSAKTADPKVTMVIFCSPHNPCGRVFTREELKQVARICLENHVFLLCDEIHADFCWPGHPFISMGEVCHDMGPEAEENLILCTSASKSYNLAGLSASDIIIPSAEARARYKAVLLRQHMMSNSLMGIIAAEAAYNGGEAWLNELKEYLYTNFRYLSDFFRDRVPGITAVESEATYMVWLDCRALGLSEGELENLFIHRAKVGVNLGSTFGPEGVGFVRLNFATPRPLLTEALERIARAVCG